MDPIPGLMKRIAELEEQQRAAQDENALLRQFVNDVYETTGESRDVTGDDPTPATALAALERMVARHDSERVARLMGHAERFIVAITPAVLAHPMNADTTTIRPAWFENMAGIAKQHAESLERLRNAWELESVPTVQA